MTKNQKKLETLLLNRIEKEMKREDVEGSDVATELAHELVYLWSVVGSDDVDPDSETEEVEIEKNSSDELPAEEEKVISIPVEVELDNIFTGLDLISEKVSEINEDLRRTNASIDLASSGLDSLRRQLPTD